MKQCLSLFTVILAASFGARQAAAAADAVQPAKLSRALPLQENAAIPSVLHTRPVVANGQKRANFELEGASDQARLVANWVANSGDNKSMPFAVVDKTHAKVFVFNANGQLRGATAEPLGLTLDDDSVPGIGDRALSSIRLDERTALASRFMAEPGPGLNGDTVTKVRTQWLPRLAAKDLPAAKTSASGFFANSRYPLPKAATGVFVREDDAFLPASRTLSLYITPKASQYTSLILDAAAQWNAACGVQFRYVNGEAPSAAPPGRTVVVVDYGPGAVDGASAMTFRKASRDKQTLSYAKVVITTIHGDADLYFLALHELGHALGLPHASDPGAVMHWTADRAYYVATGTRAGLTSTDIDGCYQMLAVAELIKANRESLAKLSF